jgi:hypothetical protein
VPTTLAAYLDVLVGNGSGWLEVRYRTNGGMRSLFYPARGRRRSLEQVVANVSARSDLYIGCALRHVRRGDKAAVAGARVLWAEFDTPTGHQALAAFSPPPTITVTSGTPGHLHAYWALNQQASAELVEDANRRLAHALGADPVCFDASRILRPPGTLNHKHQPPRPVELASYRPGPRYPLDHIIGRLPAAPAPTPPADGPVERSRPDRLLDIEPTRYVPVLTGQHLGRSSKVSCPFHRDRTPSLHAYPTPERGWFCFGCRRGGSIYDLAAQLWQLDTKGPGFLELKTRLGDLFQ